MTDAGLTDPGVRTWETKDDDDDDESCLECKDFLLYVHVGTSALVCSYIMLTIFLSVFVVCS